MAERTAVIQGPGSIRGEVRVPGDKSISHRAAILGAMARGTTTIGNYAPGDDCGRTLDCISGLGVGVTVSGSEVVIVSKGIRDWSEPWEALDCGNSGTAMRLLAGALAGSGCFAVLSGDKSLHGRPMKRVVSPLRRMGARVWGRADGSYPPLAIRGAELAGCSHELEVASAQVKTAIILAGLSARGRTSLVEPTVSRDHTERMLPEFGGQIEQQGQRLVIDGPQELRPTEIRVPADFSSAAFWMVAAAICPDSDVLLHGVGLNPGRAGLLECLRAMGARLELDPLPSVGTEPVATIRVQSSQLRGITIEAPQVVAMVDEVPLLALAGAVARGRTVIRGAGELRIKESDRLAATARGLAEMGATVTELADGLIIDGGRLEGAIVSAESDHRLAMMFAVAGLAARGETRIYGADWASVSYPSWWTEFGRFSDGAARGPGS